MVMETIHHLLQLYQQQEEELKQQEDLVEDTHHQELISLETKESLWLQRVIQVVQDTLSQQVAVVTVNLGVEEVLLKQVKMHQQVINLEEVEQV